MDLHPVPLADEALCDKKMAAAEALHAELGLLRGFYRYQARRGLCKVQRVGPNLWLPAAKGLGFFVHTVRFKDEEFRRTITDPEHSQCFLKWGIYRKCHPKLAVIFTDTASLPELRNLPYWHVWKVTHIFFTSPSSEPVVPKGWHTLSRLYDRWTLGGSTTSWWKMVVWYPTGSVPWEPVMAPSQP